MILLNAKWDSFGTLFVNAASFRHSSVDLRWWVSANVFDISVFRVKFRTCTVTFELKFRGITEVEITKRRKSSLRLLWNFGAGFSFLLSFFIEVNCRMAAISYYLTYMGSAITLSNGIRRGSRRVTATQLWKISIREGSGSLQVDWTALTVLHARTTITSQNPLSFYSHHLHIPVNVSVVALLIRLGSAPVISPKPCENTCYRVHLLTFKCYCTRTTLSPAALHNWQFPTWHVEHYFASFYFNFWSGQ